MLGLLSWDNAPLQVTVDRVEPEPVDNTSVKPKTPVDLVTLRIQVAADAKPCRYPICLITRAGVSNALPIYIVDYTVTAEPPGPHETQQSAVPVSNVPAVFAGHLSRRGEADYYTFRAEVGQTLTFEVISGLPEIASAGSAATVANFDPSLSIYDSAGSWFDAKRLKRIAYNDEPMWVFSNT